MNDNILLLLFFMHFSYKKYYLNKKKKEKIYLIVCVKGVPLSLPNECMPFAFRNFSFWLELLPLFGSLKLRY